MQADKHVMRRYLTTPDGQEYSVLRWTTIQLRRAMQCDGHRIRGGDFLGYGWYVDDVLRL